MPIKSLTFSLLFVLMTTGGCAIDGLLLTELDRKGHSPMPDPAPVRIHGRAPGLLSGTVTLSAGDTKLGEGKTDALSAFVVEVDGTTELTGALLDVRQGGKQVLGILPHIPAQKSVLDPAINLDIAQLSPGMANVDTQTTILSVLALAKARADSRSLGSVPATSMTDTLIELNDRLTAGDKILGTVASMVTRLMANPGPAAPFLVNNVSGSLLNPEALAGVDYTGDGAADKTTQAFDEALAAAVASFQFKACYVPNKIKVVLLARLAKGGKNGNCEAFDPFLWAKDLPGKRMFIAAGVHIDTPRCTEERTAHCLTEDQIDALNKTLGNWQPNRTRMYDDGSHGDAVASDGVWTLSFDAPWWDASAAVDKAGVRIAYKFTWGNDGDGWTATEEFPGNQRILELTDQNGDHIIVRQDDFGDETSNKDKANQLAPSLGGCGQMKWPSESAEGCASDVYERAVDTDGDCKVDGWPSAGNNTALTVPCK